MLKPNVFFDGSNIENQTQVLAYFFLKGLNLYLGIFCGAGS